MSKVPDQSTTDSRRTEDSERSRSCPYLDTINRSVLDFDFEKLCSISLSHLNVYGCLVCGQYFQGRSKNSYAYIHSVEASHHVWINLETLKFYCLPDNYEIKDAALNDIRNVLRPSFDIDKITALDEKSRLSRAIDGAFYYPGIVGMNNIRETDYINVVLHAILFVKPIRNFFLNEKNYTDLNVLPGDLAFSLCLRFGELARKVWNPGNFKNHVSPHEMVQCVVKVSKKRFMLEKQKDPIEFLSWFLNNLHLALNLDKKRKVLIVKRTFQGKLKTSSRKVPMTDDPKEKKELLKTPEYATTEAIQPFYFLTLDVPSPPLFMDPMGFNIIPQIALLELLCRYNGVQEKEYKTYKDYFIKRFIIIKLPKYLILHVKRFSHNYFFDEKNPTIVNFPLKGLDLSGYLHPGYRTDAKSSIYNLISNVFIDQEAGTGDKINYCIHLLHKPTSKWYLVRDIRVTEIMPPMVSLSESYIQIWEQQEINS